MALIPDLRGTVLEISTVASGYHKAVAILGQARQTYPTRDLPDGQRLMFTEPVESLPFKVGDRISSYAFPLQEDNTWEAEGVTVLGKG